MNRVRATPRPLNLTENDCFCRVRSCSRIGREWLSHRARDWRDHRDNDLSRRKRQIEDLANFVTMASRPQRSLSSREEPGNTKGCCFQDPVRNASVRSSVAVPMNVKHAIEASQFGVMSPSRIRASDTCKSPFRPETETGVESHCRAVHGVADFGHRSTSTAGNAKGRQRRNVCDRQ